MSTSRDTSVKTAINFPTCAGCNRRQACPAVDGAGEVHRQHCQKVSSSAPRVAIRLMQPRLKALSREWRRTREQ
jgi:hypothetical protein